MIKNKPSLLAIWDSHKIKLINKRQKFKRTFKLTETKNGKKV